MKEITLYDYLMWIAEKDCNITPELIADNLMISDKTDKQLMSFYKKHKYAVLRNFKESYPDGVYRGEGYDDTTITFTMDNVFYEITEVNGSFLHDNGLVDEDDTLLSKERMIEWAGELKELYDKANSDTDLADCADAMADFIDEFLKVYNK